MTDERKEWISALADGELAGRELDRALDALRTDQALQASWSRYHLISDALHSNLESKVTLDLHERVSRALDNEPTILAPQQHKRRPWVRHVASLAVAASVSGVAIIGFQQMNAPESGAPTATMAEVTQPQNFVRRDIQPVTVAAEKDNSQQLEPYLVDQHEYSVSSGVNGMVPYVRIVGHRQAAE
jgi:sigma-E factor negative regulatory protein RseA